MPTSQHPMPADLPSRVDKAIELLRHAGPSTSAEILALAVLTGEISLPNKQEVTR